MPGSSEAFSLRDVTKRLPQGFDASPRRRLVDVDAAHPVESEQRRAGIAGYLEGLVDGQILDARQVTDGPAPDWLEIRCIESS
jgi:hypothetical protein